MYVGQLTLIQNPLADHATVSDALYRLLSALRMNGQICGKEWAIARTHNGYGATVLIPEKTALEERNHNCYVRSAFQSFESLGLGEITCEVREDIVNVGVCECASVPNYILYTTYISLEPSLRCGGCFLPIPLYRIPPTKDEEFHDIISWESNYQACDTLQMNCTVLEQAALRQMSRLDSGLSQEGLSLCRRIKELTGVPVYYYLYRLYRSRGRSLRAEMSRVCPSCKGDWLLQERWHNFDFRCEPCGLVSSMAFETE